MGRIGRSARRQPRSEPFGSDRDTCAGCTGHKVFSERAGTVPAQVFSVFGSQAPSSQLGASKPPSLSDQRGLASSDGARPGTSMPSTEVVQVRRGNFHPSCVDDSADRQEARWLRTQVVRKPDDLCELTVRRVSGSAAHVDGTVERRAWPLHGAQPQGVRRRPSTPRSPECRPRPQH